MVAVRALPFFLFRGAAHSLEGLMITCQWSRQKQLFLAAAFIVVLLLAFALGVEVGTAAVYSALEAEGFDCSTVDDATIWS